MSVAVGRGIAVAIGIGTLMAVTAIAQTTPTTGRSIETLARVALHLPDGKQLRLGQRVEPGKPTVIAFWASWCLPCIAEAPHLANLRKRFPGGYNFLYINRRDGEPDPIQPPAAIAQFLTRTGMTNADYVTADVASYRRIVGADIETIPEGIVGIPRVYLFDRHGRQVYTAMGFSEARSAELEQHLNEVILAQ